MGTSDQTLSRDEGAPRSVRRGMPASAGGRIVMARRFATCDSLSFAQDFDHFAQAEPVGLGGSAVNQPRHALEELPPLKRIPLCHQRASRGLMGS